jgi:hypothetical protein
MDPIHSLQPLYSLAGLAVGLLVGLTGVGGGSLMTPILILLFGIHPATAVGTDLLYAAATKTAGSVVHGFNRTIDWHVVRLLATGSVPLTVVTIAVLGHLDITSTAARDLITAVLTVALFITALTLVFRERIVARYAARINALPRQRVGRRRRDRRHRADPALSPASHGANCRLRHRPRRSAHARRRYRALVPRFDQLRHHDFPAVGIHTGNRDRQLRGRAHTGNRAAPGAGRHIDRGGD